MGKKLYLVATIATLLCSCNPNRIYQERVDINDGENQMVWDINNIPEFVVNIEDTTLSYDLKTELRIVDHYQFANMYLFIKTIAPSGNSQMDTVNLILRDEKGFSNENRMAFGEYEDYELSFRDDVKFREIGNYKFQIQHGMRMEKLPFINQVGFIVDKRNHE